MHYHYPAGLHPDPGDGITKPPPSAKHHKRTPQQLAEHRRIIESLAVPKLRVSNVPEIAPDHSRLIQDHEKPFENGEHLMDVSEMFLDNLGLEVKLQRVQIGSAGKRALEPLIGRKLTHDLYDISNRKTSTSKVEELKLSVEAGMFDKRRSSAFQSISNEDRELLNKVPEPLRKNFNTVINGLRKPFNSRSTHEAEAIKQCLKPLKALDKIHSGILFDQLCHTFKLEEFPAKHIVFRQNDYGDAWYIILFGEVEISVALDSSMKNFKVVQVLGSGDSFGDLALVNRTLRLATVEARTHVKLLKVDKSDFEKISKFTHMITRKEIITFLRHFVPMFQRISDSRVRTIAEHVVLQRFKDKEMIIQENDSINNVFIVKNGKCNIYKDLEYDNNKRKRLYLGCLRQGCHFNDEIIRNLQGKNGSPVTAIADGEVECAVITAAGDWVNFDLDLPPSKYGSLSQKELKKIAALQIGKR
ncbi:hypothetical protein HDU84_005790 [Entophlyctis sp. JEL0112]|nr:hypothetical protein HDU84_005790 [Entophlyctis sp. JEL0112]